MSYLARALTVVGFVGCSSSPQKSTMPPPPPAKTCADAGAHLTTLTTRTSSLPRPTRSQGSELGFMQDAVPPTEEPPPTGGGSGGEGFDAGPSTRALCEAEHWPQATIDCVMASSKPDDAFVCIENAPTVAAAPAEATPTPPTPTTASEPSKVCGLLDRAIAAIPGLDALKTGEAIDEMPSQPGTYLAWKTDVPGCIVKSYSGIKMLRCNIVRGVELAKAEKVYAAAVSGVATCKLPPSWAKRESKPDSDETLISTEWIKPQTFGPSIQVFIGKGPTYKVELVVDGTFAIK